MLRRYAFDGVRRSSEALPSHRMRVIGVSEQNQEQSVTRA